MQRDVLFHGLVCLAFNSIYCMCFAVCNVKEGCCFKATAICLEVEKRGDSLTTLFLVLSHMYEV